MVVKRVSEKGIGLVLALMILAFLSMLVAAMLTAVTVEVWIGDNYRTETQLVHLTEAGIEDGREAMRWSPVSPSAVPFIESKPMLDVAGTEAGRYSVTLVRSSPLTLRSSGVIGATSKTIDVRLRKSGFPWLPQAITLNEDIALPSGVDAQLGTPEGAERIVEGIIRHATDVYRPVPGETVNIGFAGSPSDYRVVVVEGDAGFGNASGYGLLLVRGELELHGPFSWNGLIVVVGQGVMRAAEGTTGMISGAVFVMRTRAADRGLVNPLGTPLEQRGPVTFSLPAGSTTIGWSETEMERANQRFPYLPTTYREY